MGRVTVRRAVVRRDGTRTSTRADTLVVEEPLEIQVDGVAVSVTMRTPGHDFELAVGFLTTEGVLTRPGDVTTVRYCPGGSTYNVVDVSRRADGPLPSSLARSFASTSSCGICGKTSIDAVRVHSRWRVEDDPVTVPAEVLRGMPDALRAAQSVFDRTGGLHAAALFTADGSLLCLREDIGRHNAVDKVVGWAVQGDRLPLRGTVLLVSGRASFELTQKALMAGIPVLAAVSAPSSLAAELAEEAGLTLVGFLRGSSMNIYTGAHRVPT